ncbi:hypothetical protein B0H15DRAFT_800771 [Mycena belliarum]|uniref:Uncharacterized protein n=1 Tax=Mycena belliarum TaxID=1033014 RepID=A0AAD6TR64_9AGAR|nr:hypothetical protein B0H15DRAFT_806466 [Mycena belliae]KAJ7075894.1 hypothetical protein B0H15DRAFT_956132 [Mycena belliae]KAJ7088805.1 hypothetical protein B0H15DRAFT_800771 [Mycena belliae]
MSQGAGKTPQAGTSPSKGSAPSVWSDRAAKTFQTELAKLVNSFRGPGAIVQIDGSKWVVTTNADYIPDLPASARHDVYLRKDFRYGEDDYTLWPQQWSDTYCHLPAIRARTSLPGHWQILAWNPGPEDFVKDSSSLAQGLGKLHPNRYILLADLLEELFLQYKMYLMGIPANKEPAASVKPLVSSATLAIQRLESIPSTLEQMSLAVCNLQRTLLELDAMLSYLQIFRGRMESGGIAAARAGPFIGAYTADPIVAQKLALAGLPFWFIRPATDEASGQITQVLSFRSPTSQLELAPHSKYDAIAVSTNSTDKKVQAIQRVSASVEWYRDPFAEPREEAESGEVLEARQSKTVPPESQASSSRRGGKDVSRPAQTERRHAPYPKPKGPARGVPGPSVQGQGGGRNKFDLIHRQEMPPSIAAWQNSLKAVDTTRGTFGPLCKTDTYYVFPEPALIVSPDSEGRRLQRLHHYKMLRPVLLYRLGNARLGHDPLSSQEWREVLAGSLAPQGTVATKKQQRAGVIQRLLSPALKACGLDARTDFPLPLDNLPPFPINAAKEMIWEVAESNFRFELVSLDRRASGMSRFEACMECFPGRAPVLMGMPLADAKRGFGAAAVQDRHPYIMALARLMCDWRYSHVPSIIRESEDPNGRWAKAKIFELELAVTAYYTQAFFNFFGRAAVVPMTLTHELTADT